jgi:hypothetical protein
MGEEPEPQALDLTPEQLAAFRDGLARRESALHVRGGIWVIAHALLIASLFLAIGRTPTALLLITLFIALGIAAMWAVTAQASRRRLDSAYRALEDHDAVYRAFIAAGGERASLISVLSTARSSRPGASGPPSFPMPRWYGFRACLSCSGPLQSF